MIIRLILLTGICYLLFLISFVDSEIPFSEDSGIKTLMVKQYEKGDFRSTLVLTAPKWVSDLWDQGLYPFRKPFVYDLPGGKTTVFPPLFQILSTPFYSAFGFRGLYILPALSAFLFWVLFVKICKTLKLHERVIQVSLVAIIFASSLTLYAAIFWEHTLTSLLCVLGLFYVVQTIERNENPPKIRSLLFGVGTGLSLWLRPEALIILLALLLWSTYYFIYTKLKSVGFFISGILFSIAGFFLFNYLLFENPLGLRSKQIVDRFDLIQRLTDGGYIFVVLCVKTILFDPVSLLVIFCVIIMRKRLFYELKTIKPIPITYLLILLISLFYVVCPWILPNTGGNNWGIRYALVCTPFIYVLVAILSNQLLLSKQKIKPLLVVAVLLIVFGFLKNTIGGSERLYANYHGAKSKAVEYLANERTPIILITKSYHAAELESLMPQSVFVLTDSKRSLQQFLASPEAKPNEFVLLFDNDDTYSELLLKESDLKDFTLQKTFNNLQLYKYHSE